MECTELIFDNINKTIRGRRNSFFAGDIVHSYENLHQYKMFSNTEIETSRGFGLGRAIVGGALFGPAGAILGGLTKKNISSSSSCTVAISFEWGEPITVTTTFDTAMKYMQSLDYAYQMFHKDEEKQPQISQNNAEIEQLQKQIAELTDNLTNKEEPIVINSSADANALLKRAFSFLEDKEWRKAEAYSESALDIEPERAEAYLVKLMVELQVSRPEKLADCEKSFENNVNYQKALRYADSEFSSQLKHYNTEVICRPTYANATRLLCSAKTTQDYMHVEELFRSIPDYKNSAEKAALCHEKAEKIKEADYNTLVAEMKETATEAQYRLLHAKFLHYGDYKNAAAYSEECLSKARECKREADYQHALELMKSDLTVDLQNAKSILKKLGTWKNSEELVKQIDNQITEIYKEEELEKLEGKKTEQRMRLVYWVLLAVIFLGGIIFAVK